MSITFVRNSASVGKKKRIKKPYFAKKLCLRAVWKAQKKVQHYASVIEKMRLHEIYEAVSYVSILELAEKIVGFKTKVRFREPISDADWNWLLKQCENQQLIRKLTRACDSYITYNGNWNDVDNEMLRSGSVCAEALNYLREIKRDLDDDARTQILQSTDEHLNSEALQQLALQSAYVDLQNSYAEAQSDSYERVKKLASSSVDL